MWHYIYDQYDMAWLYIYNTLYSYIYIYICIIVYIYISIHIIIITSYHGISWAIIGYNFMDDYAVCIYIYMYNQPYNQTCWDCWYSTPQERCGKGEQLLRFLESDDLSLGCYDLSWDREGYDGIPGDILSGHLAVCHGKSPFLVGKPYVRTPPRITHYCNKFLVLGFYWNIMLFFLFEQYHTICAMVKLHGIGIDDAHLNTMHTCYIYIYVYINTHRIYPPVN